MQRQKENSSTIWGAALGLSAAALGLAWFRRRQAQNGRIWLAASAAQPLAVITGASSGIGAAFARQLAQQGYALLLVARREALLNQIAAELHAEFGTPVEIFVCDLSTPAGVQQMVERISALKQLELLVNNAGFGIAADFINLSQEQIAAMLTCHDLASAALTRAALPGMLAQRHGGVINLSSVSAFVDFGPDGSYGPSKAYLLAFSQNLHRALKGSGVRVQALCPGLTHTGFHSTPDFSHVKMKENTPAFVWMSADAVVRASLKALALDQVVVIPGLLNRLMCFGGWLGLTEPLSMIYRKIARR